MAKFSEGFSKALDKTVWFIGSIYFVPVLYAFALLTKHLGIQEISIPLIALSVAAILLLCKKVQNIFAILLYASFFIEDIFVNANWISYGIAIGVVVVSFFYFIIKNVFFPKKSLKQILVQFKNGKLYIPLLFTLVAYILAGAGYNFDVGAFFATIGFTILTVLVYYIALNHTENLSNYMMKMFVLGGLLVAFEMLLRNMILGGSIKAIFTTPKGTAGVIVGTQNINAAALFLLLGLIGSFGMGYKTKIDWLSLVGIAFFAAMILLTSCRAIVAIALLCTPIFLIFFFLESPKKRNLLIATLVVVALLVILCVVFRHIVAREIEKVINKFAMGLNGREELWNWCLTNFNDFPIFGCGFIATSIVPTMRMPHLILAHNTALQWLVSLGVVGCILMIPFYFTKYKIIMHNFFSRPMFLRLAIIVVELSGLVDQTAAMDIFVHLIIIVSLAALERVDLKLDNPDDGLDKKIFFLRWFQKSEKVKKIKN